MGDNLDFGKTDIGRLFVSIFIPTLIGMACISILNIADGVIVGKGLGSDALAAVNICAPLYVIATATGLLFGSGVSVVAAVLLAKGKQKESETNISEALLIPILPLAAIGICMLIYPRWLNVIFGGSDPIYPYVRDYMAWLMPMPVFLFVCTAGGFMLRLDGAPRFAMWVTAIPSCLNAFLDWLFVFPFAMGIKGAAIATSLSLGIESALIIGYLVYFSKTVKLSITFEKWARNLLHIAKMGFSTFLADISICVMIIIGNHMFMGMLHEDGVAAFSVACYLFPLIFMFGNSIAQSQMPIISYNMGKGDTQRIQRTLRISSLTALGLGTLMMTAGIFGSQWILLLFLNNGSDAFQIASEGFPIFSVGFLFITINLMFSGYCQSLGRARIASHYTLLRGIVFMIPCFLILPTAFGPSGLWAAVPAAETLTLACIAGYWQIKYAGKE